MSPAARRSLAVVAIPGLALLVHLALRASPPPARSVDRVAPATSPEPNTPATSSPSPVRDEPSESRDGASPTDIGAAEPPDPSQATPAPEQQSILGTIVVVDEHGIEHRAESGTLRVLWQANGAGGGTIDVKDGSWQTQVPRGALLSIGSIRLGERHATLLAADPRFRAPEDGVVPLRARWPARSILHVRDAATGRELTPVELIDASTWSWMAHPGVAGGEELVAEDLSSPIDVGSVVGDEKRIPYRMSFGARSPGFAWGRVDIDGSTGGERFVNLVPGGDLDITLTGSEDVYGTTLWVRRDGGREESTYLCLKLADEHELPLDSMQAGHYVVNVESRRGEHAPRILGSAEVDVVANTRTSVSIAIAERPKVNGVRVAGTVRVHRAWKTLHLQLTVSIIGGALNVDEARRGAAVGERQPDGVFDDYAFHLDGVEPGRLVLHVQDPSVGFGVEVGAEGREDIVVELAPPAHVSLRVVDDATQEDASIERLHWDPKWPDGFFGGISEWVARVPTTNRFEFDAPQGEIQVFVGSSEYVTESHLVTIHEGRNDVVVTVTRAGGFHVRLVDGEVTIPWDSSWRVRPQSVDGVGDARMTSWSSPNATFLVRNPGRYRFTIPKIDGYRPVPEQEVLVEPGRLADHVIHVEREH